MGFILWIVSNIIYYGFLPVVWLYNLYYYFINKKFFKAFKEIDDDFYNVALSNDQKGNVVYKHLFNAILIKKDSIHKFGHEDETVSSVLGKNQLSNTLTNTGKILVWVLDKLDKNHSINSIGS